MQYTLRQMRETVGLSLETCRHWKRVLPPLATRGGRVPCFSVGDLIAASVINRLTEVAGVRVGHLKDVAVDVFDLCRRTPWAALEGMTLSIDLERRVCSVERMASIAKGADLTLFCRLDPILAELRDALLRGHPGKGQAELLFPPVGVARNGRRKRT